MRNFGRVKRCALFYNILTGSEIRLTSRLTAPINTPHGALYCGDAALDIAIDRAPCRELTGQSERLRQRQQNSAREEAVPLRVDVVQEKAIERHLVLL
jgi:hypothetical protein